MHRQPANDSMSQPMASTMPSTLPTTMASPMPMTEPGIMSTQPVAGPTVATGELGTVPATPGLKPKPKPFIAIPKAIQLRPIRPTTLLLEHASPDSPIALSEYGKQPVYSVDDFHLHKGLTAAEVQKKLGSPAQLADTDDPWLVYRLSFGREIWLHFSQGTDSNGVVGLILDAADVIRGAEDGYVRDRVFSAE